MADGDDAVAAGMPILAGTADRRNGWNEINKTRDYIAQRTSAITPVAKGGTGSSTAAAARTNLDTYSKGESNSKYIGNQNAGTNLIELIWAGSRIGIRVDGTNQGDIANTGDTAGKYNASGGTINGDATVNGQVFVPNSYAASSAWTSAFIDGSGRLSKGASALRFKKYVTKRDPMELGDIFPEWHRFQMRADPIGETPAEGKWRYGPIADYMAGHPDQEGFVVYDSDGEVEAIDFIGLLLAQAAQLDVRAIAAEARADALEERLARLEALLAPPTADEVLVTE